MRVNWVLVFFSVIAIAAGLAISYWPPASNAQAIWLIIGAFLGKAIDALFKLPAFFPDVSEKRTQEQPSNVTESGFANVKLLIVLSTVGISALALQGCSLLPAQYSQIEQGAAQVVVQSAERTICRDIPIGTWIRLYGSSTDRVKGWQALCFNPINAPLNDATIAAILKVYPQFDKAVDAGTALPTANPNVIPPVTNK